MQTSFRLAWITDSKLHHRAFKMKPAFELFLDYLSRIDKLSPGALGRGWTNKEPKTVGTKRWICDRSKQAKLLSSEQLAKEIKQLQDTGCKKLEILIGGSNGIPEADINAWNPDLRWSFGPGTFPHELAAIMAAEQVYRAFTILNRLPYHLSH